MSIVGEKLAKEGTIPAEFGMWFGCLLFVPLGFWLTKKATADSGMFDSSGLFSRIANLFRRKKKSGGNQKPDDPDPSIDINEIASTIPD
jgi:lipopolysaccharide export system permease protein